MEDKVARLYVYDDKGEEIGRLVIDIERLLDMYSKAYLRDVRQGDEPAGNIMREQTTAPRSDQDQLHQKVTPHIAWWQKASDGTFYLKRISDDTDQR